MADRVLIVDDEQDFCSNLSDLLTEFGYPTDVAYRGEDAIDLATRSRHRLALLDFKLPCMTGVELFQRLRQVNNGIEAILVTGFSSNETARAANAAGMREVVEKPVDVPVLLSLIDKALR
jgi:two-component system, OmpR family, manganese sensing response regulator